MVNQLMAKTCKNISHIEVPTELLKQGGERQNSPENEGDKQGPQAKRERKTKADKEEVR